MHRYDTMTPRQIHALAPLPPLRYSPDPLWYRLPHRLRAVAYTLGGTIEDRLRADRVYATGLRTLATCPGGPWFPGIRASVASWLPGFRWDPMGPMTWPDIYVYVEAYYRRHPEQELWRSQALESTVDHRPRSPEVVRVVEVEPKTDFPWDEVPADKG